MARTFTLGPGTTENTLIRRCQRRVDLVNDDFIPDTEWKGMISTAYAELYALIANAGDRHFETITTITSGSLADDGSGGGSVALPNTHFSSRGVDRQDGQAWRALTHLQFEERNVFSGTPSSHAVAWTLIGSNLHLYPKPPSGQTYRHIFIPQPSDLSAAADAFPVDVVIPAGEEFLIAHVAVQALAKEKTDAADQERARDRAELSITAWATKRRLDNSRRRHATSGDPFDVLDPSDYRFR